LQKPWTLLELAFTRTKLGFQVIVPRQMRLFDST
jgi:hypothetical protein